MKQKFFSMHGTAVDKNGEEHIVTMVGEYHKQKEESSKCYETFK